MWTTSKMLKPRTQERNLHLQASTKITVVEENQENDTIITDFYRHAL